MNDVVASEAQRAVAAIAEQLERGELRNPVALEQAIAYLRYCAVDHRYVSTTIDGRGVRLHDLLTRLEALAEEIE